MTSQDGAVNRNGRLAGWLQAARVYADRRVGIMLVLGFSAGLPFLLIGGTLSTWLRDIGLELSVIGFLGWVGLFYSFKVLWAPVVDQLRMPVLQPWLGRRRSWILAAQAGILVGLVGMANADPASSILAIACFAVLVAFSSATQDISIDAYRIEIATPDMQGALTAAYNAGYRIALIAAGAGALYLADFFSWHLSYMVMAGCVLIGIIATFLARNSDIAAEPRETSSSSSVDGWFQTTRAFFEIRVKEPFAEFFRRVGWMGLVILAFVGLSRLSDMTIGNIASTFYIDLGFTKSEIASITKIYGAIMSVAGGIVGGLIVARFGVRRPLLFGVLAAAIPNVVFAVQANVGYSIPMLVGTISADNFGNGLAGVLFIAYQSSLTSRAYTATQYALFSSVMTLPGRFIGGWSGVFVESIGYHDFFIATVFLAIPAAILALVIMRKAPEKGQKRSE